MRMVGKSQLEVERQTYRNFFFFLFLSFEGRLVNIVSRDWFPAVCVPLCYFL